MPFGRRVSKDVSERVAADRELADGYRERLAVAARAEDALQRARGERGTEAEELRRLAIELDQALTEALVAAEAAERVAMGPKTYPPAGGTESDKAHRDAEIARRRAKAKPAVRPWTQEVDRLRTAREAHRLSYRVGPGVAA